jgi:plasmid stability protein
MADILIKNVPKEIHKKLKEMALYHHRSMTKEALSLLEEAAAHYCAGSKTPTAKTQTVKYSKREMEERRRRIREAIKRVAGSADVKMSTDELMKLTRGE